MTGHLGAGARAELLGSLDAGMVPRVEACLRAVRGGVFAARGIDGRGPHAVLARLLAAPDDESVGTTVTVNEEDR